MVKLWYAYYFGDAVSGYIHSRVQCVSRLRPHTVLFYLENERGKKSYLPYHIVHVIFSCINYWSCPCVVCVCACRHMCTVCMQTSVYCVHADTCVLCVCRHVCTVCMQTCVYCVHGDTCVLCVCKQTRVYCMYADTCVLCACRHVCTVCMQTRVYCVCSVPIPYKCHIQIL